jgi:uncharacterized repeat protein (TIGR01451 family)
VRGKVALVIIVLLLVLQSTPAMAVTPPGIERLYFYLEGESPAPAESRWLLDTNSTGNLTTYLVADRINDLHAGEPMNLTVWWRASDGTTSMTLLVEGTGSVRPTGRVCLWGTDPQRSDFTASDCGHDGASWTVLPGDGNRTFLAHITVNGVTLNLTRTLAVGPARMLLSARLVLPAGATFLVEQARADVQLVIENAGGLPALDHVVDIRYDGRILATRTVPLVPALGNHTIPLTFTPVYGATTMELVVVVGPGAPHPLGSVSVPVRAAAVLTVDTFTARPDPAVEGSKVTFTVKVTNRGNATATNASVQFLVDGGVTANASVNGLGPGNASTYGGSWTAKDPGTHAVSTRIAGTTTDAHAASLKVTAKAPGLGAFAAVFTFVLAAVLTRAARRSSRSRRA